MGDRSLITRAAGVHSPRAVVFKLLHVGHAEHLAWHDALGWTQYRLGRTYSFDEACVVEDGRDVQNGTPIGRRKIPDEGRWHAHGLKLALYDAADPLFTA